MAKPMLVELSEREQETLESWLVTFDQTWHDNALAVWVTDRLPPSGSPLRHAALAELVKIDLEHQWQRGRRVTVESYLGRYLELRPAASVGADLLLAEYQVRQQFGVPADVADFSRRFPAQAAELERLIAEHACTPDLVPCSSPPPPMSSAERDTSHASRVAETAANDGQVRDLTGAFGRYRIIRQLGLGGMGAVYLAHDTELDRQVALKVPHFSRQDDSQVLQRFLREARAAATIQHPNLCPIYDVGKIGGVHYMTMAYIEGHLVSEYIRPGKRQPERQTAGLIRKLALALQEAHAHGIVHRDLKPANIFINRRGEPVIMDFGLARRTTGQEVALTQNGALLGTPAYMAPEQALGKGESIGPSCDIYSLGVILYELLTGQRPFRGQLLEVLSQILTAEPEPPSKHRPDLDRRLEAICLKAMAKRPEDRYATMADFAAALAEYLKVRQAFPPDQSSPEPSQPEPSQPGKADVQTDESYGLTEAVAGLSQLLPKSPPDLARRGSPDLARRGSPDPAASGDRQVSPLDQSDVIPAPANVTTPKIVSPFAVTPLGRRGSPDSNEVRGRRVSAGSAKPGIRPASASRARRPRPSPLAVLTRLSQRQKIGAAIAVGVVFVLVLLGIVFKLRTPDGTLVVEIDEPDVTVEVLSEEGKVLVHRQGERGVVTIAVEPGKRRLRLEKDGIEFFAKDFTLASGGREVIRAHWEPETPAPSGGARGVPHRPDPQSPPPPPAIAPFDAVQAKEHQTAWAKYLGVPVEMTNSIGMKFMLIPPGEFTMGSTQAEIEAALIVAGDNKTWQEQIRSEAPRHKVILTQPIYLGVHEVTQTQYEEVMGQNPSSFAATGPGNAAVVGVDTSHYPVEQVSWNDAAEFCAKLSEQEKLKPFYFRAGETVTMLDGTGYRLPTEAEWEFACRAGTTTKYWIGDKDDELEQAAWFEGNAGRRTHAVGELKANPFGLFDIHGNVWEWVQDWWEPTYYEQFQERPALDPNGPSVAGSLRVVQGGGWGNHASGCRASYRAACDKSVHDGNGGFRVALVVRSVPLAESAIISQTDSGDEAHSTQDRPTPKPAATATTPPATKPVPPWALPAGSPPPAIAPFDAVKAKEHQTAWAKHLGVPVEMTNSIGMKFMLIPPGEFDMGSTDEEVAKLLEQAKATNEPDWYIQRLTAEAPKHRLSTEAPKHRVRITKPFWLGRHEVTRGQFRRFVDDRGYQTEAERDGKGGIGWIDGQYKEDPRVVWNGDLGDEQPDDHPVGIVTWNDVTAFCAWLSEKEGQNSHLPSEAQWEYACRAGTTTTWYSGNDEGTLKEHAWFSFQQKSHPVGQKSPNPWGLYDMHGNLLEWCQDWWSVAYYETSPLDNPPGASGGLFRVYRGGCWFDPAPAIRASFRCWCDPGDRCVYHGFRVAKTISSP